MVGDGALGLRRALGEVFPATREQRCWVHKVANVLNALPKSVQAGARRALNEIAQAEDRPRRAGHRGTGQRLRRQGPRRSPRWSTTRRRCCASSTIRPSTGCTWWTTNPIESTFSPVRARTRVTKGPGNRQAGLAMVFKLLEGRGPLAGGQRAAPGGAGAGGAVREGPTGRATQGGARGGEQRGRRVISGTGDPQDLTIPPKTVGPASACLGSSRCNSASRCHRRSVAGCTTVPARPSAAVAARARLMGLQRGLGRVLLRCRQLVSTPAGRTRLSPGARSCPGWSVGGAHGWWDDAPTLERWSISAPTASQARP